ncbi:inositol monophosphatase family protein [Chlamydiifrater volucris]|uniref:inositol monophosphatase family protein n=1 Tax=Chlamydiifrater volucris TaxID=2681470 RepID=UPI001BD0CF61|nr:inositol monophosphatase family protein [Chlamydiifrater volucris]
MLNPKHQFLSDYQRIIEHLFFSILPKLVWYQQNLSPFSIWKKSDGSFVTPADYGVQFLIQRKLSGEISGIPFVCEETVHELCEKQLQSVYDFVSLYVPDVSSSLITDVLFGGQHAATDTFWLIDPIDGTSGFIKNQSFSVVVSLIIDGEPCISVIACSDPNIRKQNPLQPYLVFSARKNHGSFSLCISKKSISYQKISTATALTHRFCEAPMAAYNQQHLITKRLSEILPSRPKPIRIDSQYKYACVASGKVDFFLRVPHIKTQASPWDHIPGALLTEEAGGIVSDLLGNPLKMRTPLQLENQEAIIAASNPNIHDEVLTKLKSIVQ